jgi:hypothetical protein
MIQFLNLSLSEDILPKIDKKLSMYTLRGKYVFVEE